MTSVRPHEAYVVAVGARAATGGNALQVAMTVRAGKSFVRESRFVDRAGEPIALCRVVAVGDDRFGRDRWIGLGAAPLAEAARPWMRAFAARGHAAPALPLVLAVPTVEDGLDPLDSRGARLLAALAAGAGVAIDAGRSKIVAQGRAGGIAALELAASRIGSGEDEAVLVGGVDSYFDPERLEALDAARRLHSPGCENGFIPGEGAAFVLLVSRRRAAEFSRLASIVGVATEREPRPFGSPEPCHALAITLAARRALEPLLVGGLGAQATNRPSERSARVSWALTDVVGERHRIEEWLFATGRLHDVLASDMKNEQPLMVTGDLGAASASMLVALCCVGWQTGASDAPTAIVAAHSDGDTRGALVLAQQGER